MLWDGGKHVEIETNQKNVYEVTSDPLNNFCIKRNASMKQKINYRICSYMQEQVKTCLYGKYKLKAQDIAQAQNTSWEEFKGSCCFICK